jgi:hypothetical protein
MANPNDIIDIIDVQVTLSTGGGVSVQAFTDPLFVSEFDANASFPGRLKAYTGTAATMRAALIADGFATTSAPVRQTAAAMAQQGPPNRIYIGRRDPADADWDEALTAIFDAATLADQSLYTFAVDERDPIEIEAIADWAQPQFALYIAQTSAASVYNNTPGNVAANVIAKGYDRTALLWHDPEVASNYGPATLIGRTGPFSLPSASGTVEYRIDGGALQTATILAAAATVLGSNTGPFVITDGDDFLVTIDGGTEQELVVDLSSATILSDNAETYDITTGWTLLVRVDGGGAQPVSFAGTVGSVATTAGAPFVLADLETVTFAINGGANQVVTFNTADFVNIALATAAEVNAVYTAQLTGVTVVDDGTDVTVASTRLGTSSDVEIVAGTGGALAALGYIVGNNNGTGFAAFLDAATAAEVAAEINLDTTGCVAADDGGSVRITSDTEGTSSRIQITGGLANGALGFNTNEVSGDGDFADGSAVTTAEVVTWLAANLYGVAVAVDTNAVRLTTLSRGTGSSIAIAASALATTLGFAVVTTSGSGDVFVASAATAGEIATKIAASIVGGTASDASSAIILASATSGSTSTVAVVGGTYASLFFSTFSAIGTGVQEDYADCAWLGRCSTFPLDAPNGQSTWDNQPLVGIFPDGIPSAIRSVLHETLKVNTYERRAGRNETHFGTVLFGNVSTFRYIDQRVTGDWGDARITEAFKNALNRLSDQKKKAPYTAEGIAVLEGEFRAVGLRGQTNGHWIYDDSDISGATDTGITIPTVTGQTATDIALRKVSGFIAQWQFQDAIQRAAALLNLSVTLPT